MWKPLLIAGIGAACVGEPAVPARVEDTASAATDTSDAPGALLLAFQLDPDLVPDMPEPGVGPILGAVYAEADATATGPVDGAVPLYDYVTTPLDLHTGDPSDIVAATVPLAPGVVWLLACLDGDGNGCDCADPVTVPNANKARIVGGATTRIVVTLDLLHPC